jgi:hypothetical protein
MLPLPTMANLPVARQATLVLLVALGSGMTGAAAAALLWELRVDLSLRAASAKR